MVKIGEINNPEARQIQAPSSKNYSYQRRFSITPKDSWVSMQSSSIEEAPSCLGRIYAGVRALFSNLVCLITCGFLCRNNVKNQELEVKQPLSKTDFSDCSRDFQIPVVEPVNASEVKKEPVIPFSELGRVGAAAIQHLCTHLTLGDPLFIQQLEKETVQVSFEVCLEPLHCPRRDPVSARVKCWSTPVEIEKKICQWCIETSIKDLSEQFQRKMKVPDVQSKLLHTMLECFPKVALVIKCEIESLPRLGRGGTKTESEAFTTIHLSTETSKWDETGNYLSALREIARSPRSFPVSVYYNVTTM